MISRKRGLRLILGRSSREVRIPSASGFEGKGGRRAGWIAEEDSDGEARAESIRAHSRVRRPGSLGPPAARGASERSLRPRRPRRLRQRHECDYQRGDFRGRRGVSEAASTCVSKREQHTICAHSR